MSFQNKLARYAPQAGRWNRALAEGRLHAFGAADVAGFDTFIGSGGPLVYRSFFDNNRALWGQRFLGAEIVAPARAAQADGPILVTAWAYPFIKKQLEGLGLREYADFLDFKDFLTLYHWHEHGRTLFFNVQTSLTTRCTLRCEECCLMMPDHRSPADYPLGQLTAELDLLLDAADYLFIFNLMGGEPFLHPGLAGYLEHLARHRGRISAPRLTSNGTVIPSPRVLALCRELHVTTCLSDYSAGDPRLAERQKRVIAALAEAGAPFQVLRNQAWGRVIRRDGELAHLPPEEKKAHYRRCQSAIGCRQYNDGRLFPCNAAWGGDSSKLYPAAEGDYLDLAALTARPRKERALAALNLYHGAVKSDWPAMCEHCGGADWQYYQPVETARQRTKKTASNRRLHSTPSER